MVKKNRSRFPIAVLLTTIFSRGQPNAKSCYTWRFHWLSCGNIDFCSHICITLLHGYCIYNSMRVFIQYFVNCIYNFIYIYHEIWNSFTYIHVWNYGVLGINHCTNMQFYIFWFHRSWVHAMTCVNLGSYIVQKNWQVEIEFPCWLSLFIGLKVWK